MRDTRLSYFYINERNDFNGNSKGSRTGGYQSDNDS